MNLLSLRASTRAKIQEKTPGSDPRWTDARVDEAINNRYFEGQDRLNRIRPGYFDTLAYISLVAGTAEYDRPFFKPVLGYSRLASDGQYVDCNVYSWTSVQPPAEHEVSRLFQPSTTAVVEFGSRITVYPTPTANQALGLRVSSDLAMSLTNDLDVPRLRSELHWRMAFGAAAELLADDPTYPEAAKAKLESDWLYLFAPDRDPLKRLCRLYPYRTMGRLTMEPPTSVAASPRFRRYLNGGMTVIY